MTAQHQELDVLNIQMAISDPLFLIGTFTVSTVMKNYLLI